MKVMRIAPTGQVYLNPHDFMEDFNYEMADGEWTHLEFESDNIRTKDLRRFRSYESVTSYNYGVDVTTCVVCSSDTKRLKSILKTGINTYHIKVLRMKGKNAEKILRDLEYEQEHRRLDRSDLLQIPLTPLIGGKMSRQERSIRGYQLLKGERDYIEHEEMACMESGTVHICHEVPKKTAAERNKGDDEYDDLR